MSAQDQFSYPKLHNAMWPGLVGKGSPGAEPSIDLDSMLDLTAGASVNGTRFDGVDLFLYDPHISIDIDDDGIKRLAEKVQVRGFVIGSVVAPVWAPTGGGSAIGGQEDRMRFVGQVRKACRIAKRLRELGCRPYGIVRIDSACGVTDWAKDPQGNQARIAQTFSEACDVAASFGERLAAEGEICWGGMHSWKHMVDLLQWVNRPATLGFQADMAHTLLYVLGYNALEDAIIPPNWDWSDPAGLDAALKTLTDALRPWTIDFHVAQNDATVKGSGTHDKTGHHCMPNDPGGKLNIPHHAGFWLRGADGQATKAFQHICWDGCMFPNSVMTDQNTWNNILQTMIAVRDAHGWKVPTAEPQEIPAPTITFPKEPAPEPKASKPTKPPRKKSRTEARRVKAPPKPKARKVVPRKFKPRKVSPRKTSRKTKLGKAGVRGKARPIKRSAKKVRKRRRA